MGGELFAMLAFIAAYLGVQTVSVAAHSVSYALQGGVYIADEARRSMALGPKVTNLDVQLVPPAAAHPDEEGLFACVRTPESEPGTDCLNRGEFTHFVGSGVISQGQSGASEWRFSIPVDNAPESLCLDFYDHYKFSRGSWLVGSESLPSFVESFSALPHGEEPSAPIGSLCVSGIPSPGAVSLHGVTCSSDVPSICRAADVTIEAATRS